MPLVAALAAFYWWSFANPTTTAEVSATGASTPVPKSSDPLTKSVDSAAKIWNGEPGRSYSTLVSAVKDAVDGDVISIAGDLTTEQIDIVGKRLTIRAVPDSKATIRPTEWALEHSPFLFRADRDLTVQGLDIQWHVKTEPLSEPGATLSAVVAMTQPDAALLVEDCTITRTQGICVASAGNLTVRRCRLDGGKFALGWVANNSHLSAADCQLNCESSVVVLFPPANTAFRETSTIHFDKCTSIGQGFIDFILFRHVEHAVDVLAEKCVFDVERMVQLSGTTIVANLNWDWTAQAVAKATLKWRETDCVHQSGIEYIASRRVRVAPNRWMMGDVHGLEAWQKFWATSKAAIQNASEKAKPMSPNGLAN